MPLDAQAEALLARFGPLGDVAYGEVDPGAARQAFDAVVAPLAGAGPQMASVEDLAAAGPAGDVPVRVYRPEGAPAVSPALVWFHGGGWVVGNLTAADPTCRQIAAEAGIVVASVEYRLAPEHPYPAALDDAMAAVRWVHDSAERLAVDVAALAVGGDSAGGNLAAAVTLRARDEGGPPIRFQLLVCPVLDSHLSYPSARENAEGYLLTTEALRWLWRAYLGDADPEDPHASPVHAADLSGLPPALVITAEFDPLRDEGEAYAARLAQAGVPAEARRVEGHVHGFFTMAGELDATPRVMAEAAADLRKALG